LRLSPFGNILKAKVLRPDKDEEIQQQRNKLEQQSTKAIAKELKWVQGELFQNEPTSVFETTQRTQELFRQERVRDVLARMLSVSADLGVELVTKQFENFGLSFDWTLAHATARDWALQHTDTLLAQLGVTNNRVVGQAVANWITNGEPLSALIRDLEIVFGSTRAERIAITETTRAFAQGTLQGYALAGYGVNPPTVPIPQHVRCRCGYGLRFNADGSAEYIYFTSVDERVCPICTPLNGTSVGIAKLPLQAGLNAN
jgi:hypothetical protein